MFNLRAQLAPRLLDVAQVCTGHGSVDLCTHASWRCKRHVKKKIPVKYKASFCVHNNN